MVPKQVVPDRRGLVEIGKIKENLVTEVAFDCADLGDGSGAYAVVFQRPKDAAPYPVAFRAEWPNIIWIVQAADTAKPGTGKVEIRWFGNGAEVGKSKTYVVRVNDGLPDPTEAPQEWAGYIGQVAQNAKRAETAAASATEAARSAETSAGQAGLSADNAAAALKKLEDGIASGDFRGEKGDKGDKGDVGPAGPQGPKGEVGPAGDTTAADAAAAAAQAAAQEAQTAAEASAGSAAQAAKSVAGLADDLAALKAESTALKTETDRTARSLDYLWKKSKGIIYDTETVTGAGSSVTVPSGAMDYAALRMVGGMIRKGRNLLDITRYTEDTHPSDGITTKKDSNAIIFNVPVTMERWQAFRITLSDIGAGTYVVTANIDSTDADFTPAIGIYKDDGGTPIAIESLIASGAKTVTIPDGSIMRLYFHATTDSGAKVPRTVKYTNVMISKTAVAYEPYTNSLLDAPVDAVRVQGRNLLNPQIDGKAISINTGLPTNDARMCITDFIPVTSGDTYGMYSDFGNLGKLNVACYDATKTYTGKHPVDNLAGFKVFTIPVGTAYIRCCILMTGKKTSYLYRGVSAGTANDYTPYYRSTYPIPQAIRDLCPDYGQGTAESYNYIDFAAKAYYHVGSMSQDGTWMALATPEIIDLSAVWPNDDFGVLQVEAGGTINLHYPALDNGFELAVPSETEIMVDVAKVVGTDG